MNVDTGTFEALCERVDEVDPVVPCGHTDPVGSWWAETLPGMSTD